MKDEEIAEQFAKEKLSKEDYKLSEEVIKPIYHNAIKNDYSFAKYGVECFLAGLKAGRPQWHDLRKNPNDLPKELHDVLCFVIHNEHRYILQGYLRDGRWVLSSLGTYLKNDDVVAWCEPRLDKE